MLVSSAAFSQTDSIQQPMNERDSVIHIKQGTLLEMSRGGNPLPNPNTGIASKTVVEEHSPKKAILLSLIPGAGQIYNHQAWKVPIFYGLFGGLGYFMYSSYSNMSMFKTEYLHRVNNNGERVLEDYKNYPDNSIYNYYQSYNQRFQLSIVLTVVVYGLNLVDAYVFGHLFDFQIDDNLSMSLQPSMMKGSDELYHPSFSISLVF